MGQCLTDTKSIERKNNGSLKYFNRKHGYLFSVIVRLTLTSEARSQKDIFNDQDRFWDHLGGFSGKRQE